MNYGPELGKLREAISPHPRQAAISTCNVSKSPMRRSSFRVVSNVSYKQPVSWISGQGWHVAALPRRGVHFLPEGHCPRRFRSLSI